MQFFDDIIEMIKEFIEELRRKLKDANVLTPEVKEYFELITVYRAKKQGRGTTETDKSPGANVQNEPPNADTSLFSRVIDRLCSSVRLYVKIKIMVYQEVYQAIEGFDHYLKQELEFCEKKIDDVFTNLYKVSFSQDLNCGTDNSKIFWQQNIWLNPFTFNFDSISQAAKTLKSKGRSWAPCFFKLYRRGALIQEKLPHIPNKPKPFPWTIPKTPLGAWTLLDEHTIMASAECSSPFPGGHVEFVQNHFDAPSRAYLKLYEAFTRCGTYPSFGSKCFEAGASPGGWTWVLADLGADVIACDRSPIDRRLLERPNVSFIKHDAFTLLPSDIGAIDWFLCDVICYPRRLWDYLQKWLESGLCRNFICTIKMQGECDFEAVRLFAGIKGAEIVHLCYNKHELTFMLIDRGFSFL